MKLLKELMLINENSDIDEISEATRAYRRKGGKITRGVRCTAGPRKGRVVDAAAKCFGKKNRARARIARMTSKRTKAVRVRKSKMTKKRYTSRKIRDLNKRSRR